MEQRLGLGIAFLTGTQLAHQLQRPDFVRMGAQDVPELLLSGGQLIVADKLGNSTSGRDFSNNNRNQYGDDQK